MITTILMTLAWLIATVLIALFLLILWGKTKYFILNAAIAIKCKYGALKTKNADVKKLLNECASYFWYLAIKQPTKNDNDT